MSEVFHIHAYMHASSRIYVFIAIDAVLPIYSTKISCNYERALAFLVCESKHRFQNAWTRGNTACANLLEQAIRSECKKIDKINKSVCTVFIMILFIPALSSWRRWRFEKETNKKNKSTTSRLALFFNLLIKRGSYMFDFKRHRRMFCQWIIES